MNENYYSSANLSELVADLFHEAGHAVAGDIDWLDENGNPIEETDSFGRPYMHHDIYDDVYNYDECP